jgi:methionyl-tRNA formyltransferase
MSFDEIKIKIKDSPKELFDKFRGLYPWPGLWTEIEINGEKKRLKITEMDLFTNQNGISAVIKKVQLAGKKETDFEQFKAAYL